MCDPESTGLDTLLEKIMDPTTQQEPGTQNDYMAPKQAPAPKQIKESISRKETKTGHRRSPRMTRATEKYWESIKVELRNPNQDD